MRYLLGVSWILAVAMCVPVHAEQAAPTRTHVAPGGYAAAYRDWHYSPVVKIGQTVIVSGVPAAHGDSYEDKVRNMFRTAEALLKSAGASMADVVEITTYHAGAVDSEAFRAEYRRFAPIHAEFFKENYPAWTATGTTALMSPEAVVEMRLMAVIGSGAHPAVDFGMPPEAKAEQQG